MAASTTMTTAAMAVKKVFDPLFISHGAPTLVLEKENPSTGFLRALGEQTGKPSAIVVISGHWETRDGVSVTTSTEQLYDFYGFPDELYQLKYRPPASPLRETLAAKIASLIRSSAGVPCNVVGDRPLDHGTWVPLLLMYPSADIPVLQISMNKNLDMDYHLKIGKALRPLVEEDGVLFLGSGGSSHNFELFFTPTPRLVEATHQWEGWLEYTITRPTAQERNQLLTTFKTNPLRKIGHPRDDHFVPIAVVAGAASGRAHKVAELQGHRPYYYMSNFRFEASATERS